MPLPDLAAGLVDLHTRGVRVIGADGDASMTVREVDLRGPVVIVTGSEGRGLNARVRKRVDLMARIPMRGKVASLNASVAGSVFLFEAAAQRDLPEVQRPPGELAGEHPEAAAAHSPDQRQNEVAGAEVSPSQVGERASGRPDPVTLAEAGPDDLLPEVPPAPRPDASA